MLDIAFIRDNAGQVRKAVADKRRDADIDRLLTLDTERRALQQAVDEKRAAQNAASREIAAADGDARAGKIAQMSALKEALKVDEQRLDEVTGEWQRILLSVPNVTSPDMPIGVDDSENVTVRTWGTPRDFDFPVRDHVDLGLALGIIDTEKSGEVSGSRFYYLKGAAVHLQFALAQHVFRLLGDEATIAQVAREAGLEGVSTRPFTPMLPPVIMRKDVMKKMDRLDPEDQRYVFDADEQVFVGSAEHTMGPYHMGETFDAADLPIRYIGYSTAFRREAGTYGKDMRGILRVHQFDKMEMESFATMEQGAMEQRLIVALQEHIVRSLGIPYRVVHVCTGDTGKPDYDQFDIECWIPSQQTYRETHTSDYMTDYQARRLGTAYKDADGKRHFVHMNDATAAAMTRMLIAIIENGQNADGSITVPDVLRSYMPGGMDRIA